MDSAQLDLAERFAPVPDPFAELKQRALAAFSDWLDELEERDLADLRQEADEAPDEPPGLHTLLGELVALRQDVRLQARASQTAASHLEDLGHKVESGIEQAAVQLGQAANATKSLVPEARREAQRAIALELVSLLEGLSRCETAVQGLALPRFLLGRRRAELRKQLLQPLGLLLAKGKDAMHRLRLAPIAEVGDAFDPSTMRAVGTSRSGAVLPGHVAEVIRQGYRLGPEVLQTAEVSVESP